MVPTFIPLCGINAFRTLRGHLAQAIALLLKTRRQRDLGRPTVYAVKTIALGINTCTVVWIDLVIHCIGHFSIIKAYLRDL